ncbi:MAG: hypothetical protein KGO49_04205 [Gammaproteobacteria bacterium]|nr:hypothetical protein [Gammaproteobacteria bacterium]
MNKIFSSFHPKIFVISMTISMIIAGIISRLTSANFWIIFLIMIVAMLINGWIAGIEDQDN